VSVVAEALAAKAKRAVAARASSPSIFTYFI